MRTTSGRLVIALAAAACLLPASAVAQHRIIPADAQRAEMTLLSANVAKLDDQTVRLAPGALIRDQRNVIVLPTMVPAGSVVRYQLDPQGMLGNAWILNPTELAQEAPAITKPVPAPVEEPSEDEDAGAEP